MSKRKPNNMQARMQRSCSALLRQHHVAVVDVEASEAQCLVDWTTGARITSKHHRTLVDAVCDFPHSWVVYLAALCVDQLGQRYMKSVEVAPEGRHLAKALEPIIEQFSVELKAGCNPAHLRGMAWIAVPNAVTLSEAQAAAVFESARGWAQTKEQAA